MRISGVVEKCAVKSCADVRSGAPFRRQDSVSESSVTERTERAIEMFGNLEESKTVAETTNNDQEKILVVDDGSPDAIISRTASAFPGVRVERLRKQSAYRSGIRRRSYKENRSASRP